MITDSVTDVMPHHLQQSRAPTDDISRLIDDK